MYGQIGRHNRANRKRLAIDVLAGLVVLGGLVVALEALVLLAYAAAGGPTP